MSGQVRHQIVIYCDAELEKEVAVEARRLGFSISTWAKQVLAAHLRDKKGTVRGIIEAQDLRQTEKHILEAMHSTAAHSLEPIRNILNAIITMIDQGMLSMLVHLQEIPAENRLAAESSAVRRHNGWRNRVDSQLSSLSKPTVAQEKRWTNENND